MALLIPQALGKKLEEWEGCVQYLLDCGSQNPCWNGTQSLYSEEEKEELGAVFTMIAEYECFRYGFNETCFELYGDGTMYENGDYYGDEDQYINYGEYLSEYSDQSYQNTEYSYEY